MKRLMDLSKLLAYYIIIAGSLLALASSLAPVPTGAYELSFGYLLLGITPYFLYGCFLDIFKNSPFVVTASGIVLLAVDVVFRLDFHVINTSPTDLVPALYLCLGLSLFALPLGAASGKLTSMIFRGQ